MEESTQVPAGKTEEALRVLGEAPPIQPEERQAWEWLAERFRRPEPPAREVKASSR